VQKGGAKVKACLLIVAALSLMLGSGCRGDRRPDTLRASLPDGGSVEYRAILIYDAGFHETRKELIWTSAAGVTKTFLINDTHAGYDEIEIRLSNDGKRLWIVDVNRDEHHFGGALNMETGEFYREMLSLEVREFGLPVHWADKSGGLVLARRKFR